MREEEVLAVALASTSGIGRASLYRLTERTGSLKRIFDMEKDEIIDCIGVKTAKKLFEIVGAGGEDGFIKCMELGKSYIEKYKKEGIVCISCMSEAFPERLKQIPDPPFCLYVKGELPSPGMPCVAIVGARACSAYGRSVAYSFGKELAAAGVGIVSGMARGIDGIAQEGAVAACGKTFAVLGGGVDVCYPSEHRALYEAIGKNGGIVSEYTPGTMPRANFFPERNRIISGMADIVLVIEARKRSGTYITVTQALEQGRDVYAVPGRVTDVLSDGCNSLIRDGAGLADSVETILSALSIRAAVTEKRADVRLNEENEAREDENEIRRFLIRRLELTPLHLNLLYEEINGLKSVSMAELMGELVRLELEGVVESRGSYYAKRY